MILHKGLARCLAVKRRPAGLLQFLFLLESADGFFADIRSAKKTLKFCIARCASGYPLDLVEGARHPQSPVKEGRYLYE